jgi:hypothetical protein
MPLHMNGINSDRLTMEWAGQAKRADSPTLLRVVPGVTRRTVSAFMRTTYRRWSTALAVARAVNARSPTGLVASLRHPRRKCRIDHPRVDPARGVPTPLRYFSTPDRRPTQLIKRRLRHSFVTHRKTLEDVRTSFPVPS